MIDFGPEICSQLHEATSREWLETNGLGGFASSTLCGLNTRRYHALLVASLNPPLDRVALLSRLEETLLLDGRRYELGANQYPGAIHPDGYRHLVRFRLDPFPVFTYRVGSVELEKSLFLVHGENSVVVRYRLAGSGRAALEVRPLVAFRDYHGLGAENDALDPAVASSPGSASIAPYAGMPRLHFAHNAAALEAGGCWYRSFEYREERERGFDWREDLFNPFALRFDLGRERSAVLIASLEPRRAAEAEALREREIHRRRMLTEAAGSRGPLVQQLVLAADQFIARRGEGKTVLAGYPWFTDWGRDTMIALPGLTLATGRPEIARSILLEFARHVDQGMLPNRFPDAAEAAEYNTVDATLWFFEAVRAYRERTGDDATVRDALYPVLREIIEWHVRGTRHGIRVEEDGLLHAGEPGVQLTWMDARIGDWVVTPRHGKPVEVQALWYHALRVTEELARLSGDPAAASWEAMAARARRSFNRLFWNPDRRCLFDVVGEAGPDPSMRPNQIFAVSLPHTMLSAARAGAVVDAVRRELLTPLGLRSLAAGDSRYRPAYEGDPWSRDAAYHQGTVWSWLMGPFLTAYLRVHGGSARARAQAAEWLLPLREHLREAGVGQVSEIFDGDPPHRPRGCIAQAWSVGELLRAAEEIDLPPPGANGRPRALPGRLPRRAAVAETGT